MALQLQEYNYKVIRHGVLQQYGRELTKDEEQQLKQLVSDANKEIRRLNQNLDDYEYDEFVINEEVQYRITKLMEGKETLLTDILQELRAINQLIENNAQEFLPSRFPKGCAWTVAAFCLLSFIGLLYGLFFDEKMTFGMFVVGIIVLILLFGSLIDLRPYSTKRRLKDEKKGALFTTALLLGIVAGFSELFNNKKDNKQK